MQLEQAYPDDTDYSYWSMYPLHARQMSREFNKLDYTLTKTTIQAHEIWHGVLGMSDHDTKG